MHGLEMPQDISTQVGTLRAQQASMQLGLGGGVAPENCKFQGI